jgi:hypothetical protein
MCLVNLALYVPYTVFDDWSYLRFLLPTIPLLLILVVAVLDAIQRRIRVAACGQGRLSPSPQSGYVGPRKAAPTYEWVSAVVVIALAVMYVREARERPTFVLQELEARFERAGRFVGARLPPNAAIVTSSESGSVRFYAGRKTLVWDGLERASLERAIAFLRAKGHEPYLLFERREEPDFRQRFSGSAVARLDWPPMAEVASQVRIYRPEDRDRYLQGDLPPTEYVP